MPRFSDHGTKLNRSCPPACTSRQGTGQLSLDSCRVGPGHLVSASGYPGKGSTALPAYLIAPYRRTDLALRAPCTVIMRIGSRSMLDRKIATMISRDGCVETGLASGGAATAKR